MNISTVLRIASFIGRGPSAPGLVTRVMMFAIGILFALFAIAPGTRGGGVFSRGQESRLINATGRVVLGAVALVILCLALGILH